MNALRRKPNLSYASSFVLMQAEDAVLVDSSYMTVEDVITEIMSICEKAKK